MHPESACVDGPRAYFLVGPTAVGKSAVAHYLARQDRRDILSTDSMLIYRGMDIGTDKPNERERLEVRYWGLDLATPDQSFSVGDYMEQAARAFQAAAVRPLLAVGGTGLYVKCLTEGLDALPPANAALREQAEQLLLTGGLEALQRALKEKSPDAYAALADPQNPRRLVRAFELAETFAVRTLAWNSQKLPLIIGLEMKRADLYKRIERRIRRMFEGGLMEEARELRAKYPEFSQTALQAIGYAEALACLDGAMNLNEAIERTAVRTRRLAKRQMTWFRHQANVCWIEVNEGMTVEETAGQVRSLWEKYGSTSVLV
ncbi:MAG: tRNA (adenosine(37)-N6)-dimethylallyltransferase MiaA [Lentisphaerae bacterium GWF2_57_35]|nr:MAG: tRNA (adenosine(37)-N6)-dimethylallyltransferase MiaA [Lentisphaerae bacterium GWF2_57_35]